MCGQRGGGGGGKATKAAKVNGQRGGGAAGELRGNIGRPIFCVASRGRAARTSAQLHNAEPFGALMPKHVQHTVCPPLQRQVSVSTLGRTTLAPKHTQWHGMIPVKQCCTRCPPLDAAWTPYRRPPSRQTKRFPSGRHTRAGHSLTSSPALAGHTLATDCKEAPNGAKGMGKWPPEVASFGWLLLLLFGWAAGRRHGGVCVGARQTGGGPVELQRAHRKGAK